MFQVLPANVNERNVLDTKKDRFFEKGVRCIVADNRYINKKHAALFATANVLLNPKTTLAETNALLGQPPCIPQHKSQHVRQREKLLLNPFLIC